MKKCCGNCTAYDREEEYCPYYMTEKGKDDEGCGKWEYDKYLAEDD